MSEKDSEKLDRPEKQDFNPTKNSNNHDSPQEFDQNGSKTSQNLPSGSTESQTPILSQESTFLRDDLKNSLHNDNNSLHMMHNQEPEILDKTINSNFYGTDPKYNFEHLNYNSSYESHFLKSNRESNNQQHNTRNNQFYGNYSTTIRDSPPYFHSNSQNNLYESNMQHSRPEIYKNQQGAVRSASQNSFYFQQPQILNYDDYPVEHFDVNEPLTELDHKASQLLVPKQFSNCETRPINDIDSNLKEQTFDSLQNNDYFEGLPEKLLSFLSEKDKKIEQFVMDQENLIQKSPRKSVTFDQEISETLSSKSDNISVFEHEKLNKRFKGKDQKWIKSGSKNEIYVHNPDQFGHRFENSKIQMKNIPSLDLNINNLLKDENPVKSNIANSLLLLKNGTNSLSNTSGSISYQNVLKQNQKSENNTQTHQSGKIPDIGQLQNRWDQSPSLVNDPSVENVSIKLDLSQHQHLKNDDTQIDKLILQSLNLQHQSFQKLLPAAKDPVMKPDQNQIKEKNTTNTDSFFEKWPAVPETAPFSAEKAQAGRNSTIPQDVTASANASDAPVRQNINLESKNQILEEQIHSHANILQPSINTDTRSFKASGYFRIPKTLETKRDFITAFRARCLFYSEKVMALEADFLTLLKIDPIFPKRQFCRISPEILEHRTFKNCLMMRLGHYHIKMSHRDLFNFVKKQIIILEKCVQNLKTETEEYFNK